MAISNISHPTEQYKKLGVTPESHIAIIFEKKGIGPDGQTRAFPDPRGMSGSPVWLLYDDQEAPSDQKLVRVVGVAIEHRKDQRTILATDISLAFALIYELQRRLEAAALLIGYRTVTPQDRAEEIRKKYRPEQHTLDELEKMIEDEIIAAVTEVEESWGKIANTTIANEREACAKIADETKAELSQQPQQPRYGRTRIKLAEYIAKEIRARGNLESPIDYVLRRLKEHSENSAKG